MNYIYRSLSIALIIVFISSCTDSAEPICSSINDIEIAFSRKSYIEKYDLLLEEIQNYSNLQHEKNYVNFPSFKYPGVNKSLAQRISHSLSSSRPPVIDKNGNLNLYDNIAHIDNMINKITHLLESKRHGTQLHDLDTCQQSIMIFAYLGFSNTYNFEYATSDGWLLMAYNNDRVLILHETNEYIEKYEITLVEDNEADGVTH